MFLLLFTCTSLLRAQGSLDSTLYLNSVQKLSKFYYASLKENAPIYNGSAYTGHGQNIEGHPFFLEKAAFIGQVEYDGVWYINIPMQYDLIDDAVVIKDFTGNYPIKLNSQKIRSFKLDSFEFVQAYQISSMIPAGFYQRLYKGGTQVLAKKKKQVLYRTNEEKTIANYQEFKSYFIVKDGVFTEVSKVKQLFAIYSDKTKEIKNMIGQKKLSFRKNPEQMLTAIASFYDQTKR